MTNGTIMAADGTGSIKNVCTLKFHTPSLPEEVEQAMMSAAHEVFSKWWDEQGRPHLT